MGQGRRGLSWAGCATNSRGASVLSAALVQRFVYEGPYRWSSSPFAWVQLCVLFTKFPVIASTSVVAFSFKCNGLVQDICFKPWSTIQVFHQFEGMAIRSHS